MSAAHPTDETREQAALYALGTLEAQERVRFEAHLRTGCEACRSDVERFQSVAEDLALTVEPVPPAAHLRSELMATVRHLSRQPSEAAGFTFAFSSQGQWFEMLPGVTMRVLFTDQASKRTTALVRLAPGASLPAHQHGGMEEVFIVDGQCVCGGRLFQTGDYQRAEPGTTQEATFSAGGCLFYTTFSQDNRLA